MSDSAFRSRRPVRTYLLNPTQHSRLSPQSDYNGDIFAENFANLESWATKSGWLEKTAAVLGNPDLKRWKGELLHTTNDENWRKICEDGHFKPFVSESSKLGDVVYFFQSPIDQDSGQQSSFARNYYIQWASQKGWGDGVAVVGSFQSEGLFDLQETRSRQIIQKFRSQLLILQESFWEESPYEDWQTNISGAAWDTCIPYMLFYRMFPSVLCIQGQLTSQISGFVGKEVQVFCSTVPIPRVGFEVQHALPGPSK